MNRESQLAKRTTIVIEEREVPSTIEPIQRTNSDSETNIMQSPQKTQTVSGLKQLGEILGHPALQGIIAIFNTVPTIFKAIIFIGVVLGGWIQLTPMMEVNKFEIGKSTRGESLIVTQVGNGPHHLVLIGGVHANEEFSKQIVAEVAAYFQDNTELVPLHTALYFLPALNIDSKKRRTLTNVDLNRNWDTNSWVANSTQPEGIVTGSGGDKPFSEPETAALSAWLLNQKEDSDSIRIISYHIHDSAPEPGGVQPGYIYHDIPEDSSDVLAKILVKFGYTYTRGCCKNYTPTGEFINWAATKGITIVEVELPSNGIATVAGKQAAIQKARESIIAVVDMLD